MLVAIVGFAIKHAVDLAVAELLFSRPWSLKNYIVPLGIPTPFGAMTSEDRLFVITMLAVALPFAWVGLAITTKRFRTIGWPSWTVLLFFVPIANVASFLVAAIGNEKKGDAPGKAWGWISRLIPQDLFAAAFVATIVTAIPSVALAMVGTDVLGEYGWGTFAGIPFAQGAAATLLLSCRKRVSVQGAIAVALVSVLLTGLAFFALALEGGICIAMALPIAAAFAVMGALFACALQGRRGHGLAALLVCALLAPAVMGADAVAQTAPTYRVESSVVIDAPASVVWRNVIRFPDLPPPTQLMFRAGIAYPERARIVGHGVGAVRYCEFSTGAFVKPITVWKRDRELAFNVAHNPEPLREFSPYGALDTRHLHGYLVSRHGMFLLQPLADGRTKLVGITWYQHHLWPASYWAFYSNGIIHEIHMRVLDHIKRISEAEAR